MAILLWRYDSLPPQLFTQVSGIVIIYLLRVNISIAIEEMGDDLEWSNTKQGLMLVLHLLFINCN